jgi:hypothetical protein
MIFSRKWEKEITSEIGRVTKIKGSRGLDSIDMLPLGELMKEMQKLKTGDIIFFIKNPKKRISEEIVGHIGIIKIENKKIYLIHAGGIKSKGGAVKKVLFKDYIKSMPFIGAKITRFD